MGTEKTSFRRPPGPSAPLAIGIDPETLDRLVALRDEYGPISSVEKPSGRLAYFINDASEVRRILTRRHAKYVKGPGFERVKMLLGNGLIVSDGDDWRRSRTMIQPSFTRQSIHLLTKVMHHSSEHRIDKWSAVARDGGTLNINVETNSFALELILRSILGDDYDASVAGDNPFAFLAEDSARDLGVVMKARNLRGVLQNLVDARRQTDQSDVHDFLAMYVRAVDKQGEPYSDRELLDELMTLIIAGFETSANTLSWVWYLLAGHPEVEAQVLAELRDKTGGDVVTPEVAAELTYTQQVLEETLRLYPPVWLFTRRANEQDTLEDYDIPEGTDLYFSPYIMQRSPEYWPDPDRFDPDRFAPDAQQTKDRPYFPFSLGPRRCVGEYFSFLEMKIHLALLLPKFRMMRVSLETPELELAINLRSKGDIFLKPEVRND
jgi:cytochrome P450